MGFFRLKYWSGLPCPSLRDLPDPGIEPRILMSLLHWPAGSLPLVPHGKPLGHGFDFKSGEAPETIQAEKCQHLIYAK